MSKKKVFVSFDYLSSPSLPEYVYHLNSSYNTRFENAMPEKPYFICVFLFMTFVSAMTAKDSG